MSIALESVGYVRGGRSEPVDDGWDAVHSVIELDPDLCGPAALMGLSAFSHAEIVYLLDRVGDTEIVSDARYPRGREDWPLVGIFAQRGKNRPNRLGVSVCRIDWIDGLRLGVQGLDAVDGSPVLDIKPVMSGFLPRGEIREPEWALEIMARYWSA